MALKAILFIHKSITFLSHVFDPSFTVDLNLVSGFLSAIDAFSTSIAGSSVETMNFSNSSMIMRNIPIPTTEDTASKELVCFTIACLFDKADTPAKMVEKIDLIKDEFLSVYSPEDVAGWDGNVLTFIPFKAHLAQVLGLEPMTKGDEEASHLQIARQVAAFEEAFALGISQADGTLIETIAPSLDTQDVGNFCRKVTQDMIHGTSDTYDCIVPRLDKRQLAFVHVMRIKDPAIVARFKATGAILVTGCYFIGDQHQVYITRVIPRIKKLFSECFASFIQPGAPITDDQWKDGLVSKCTITKPMKALLDSIKTEPVMFQDAADFKLVELKNQEQLIHALVAGDPVLVTGGHPDWVRRIVNIMLMFTPHRPMQIIENDSSDIDAAGSNAIVINPKNEKKFKNSVVVDLNKNQVKNGDKNKYTERLWKEVKSMTDPVLIASHVKRRVNWLMSKAALLRHLSWGKGIDPSEIAAIRMDLEPDTEKLVLKLAAGQNATIQNLVDFLSEHVPVNQLLIDQNFILFGAKKILVNGNLSPEQAKEYFDRLVKFGNMLLGPKVMNTYFGS
nr:hypothetical protein [Candidatus Sigynarchaeota archaeon]